MYIKHDMNKQRRTDMSYQQRSTIASIAGLVVSYVLYEITVNSIYSSLMLNSANDLTFIVGAFLLLIPILFIFQLIAFGVYVIFERIFGKETIRTQDDEMDKMIDCRATNICLYIIVFGFIISASLLLFDLQLKAIFRGMGLSIFIGSLFGFAAKLRYYARGL